MSSLIRRRACASHTMMAAMLVAAGLAAGQANAQESAQPAVPPGAPAPTGQPDTPTTVVPISGDRLSGFVLPIEPVSGDISMRAMQAWNWQVDDTQRLLLRGDVQISLAGNTLRGREAAVWINRLPSAGGLINQVAVYFDEASDPTQRAGLGPRGQDLLITGSARGEVTLDAPFVSPGPPPESAVLTRGERRLADHLRRLLVVPQKLSPLATVDQPKPPPEQIPTPGASPVLRADQLPTSIRLPAESPLKLFNPQGLIAFSARSVTIDERADLVIADGDVVVDYLDEEAPGGPRRLSLVAERAVIYLQPGTLARLRAGARQMRAESVLGVYLEGDVVGTDGRYTVRGNRVYYDVQANRAVMAQAVLRTYVRGGRVPIIARADEMRQLSADQWEAHRARVSTSEFFTPHLSMGAAQVTVERAPESSAPAPGPAVAGAVDGGRTGVGAIPPASGMGGGVRAGGTGRAFAPSGPGPGNVLVSGRDLTLRAGNVPFFWWPGFSAESGDFPLRSVAGGYSEQFGARIETSWDLLALAGVEDRSRVQAELEVDGFTKRGPALGTKFNYDFLGDGSLALYGLHDDGIDRTSSGLDVEPGTKWRGYALGEHRARVDQHWTIDLQLSWISDQTFITSWRELEFAERREFETSAYVLRQQDNHALTLLGKYNLNQFISNEWLLGSRAYYVDRLPEASYRRYGDSLGDVVTWSSEYRAGLLKLLPTKGTPASLGVPGAAFGLPQNANIRQAFFDRGYRTNQVARLETRQEFAVPFSAGPVRIVPYAAGYAIGYFEDEFAAFSSDAKDFRWFGSAGVRATTQFQRVDNSVESRLFDLHRIRHIIEPGITAWYGYSNVPEGSYPIYDQEIEGIGGTAAIAIKLRNTWQTQRGGPGRWRSVDFLTVDLGGLLNGSDADIQSPTPQWFEWRPEYSRWGDHAWASGIWQVTDQLALSGMGVWDFENEVLARGSVGVELNHSPDLATFIEYRTIDAENSELLEVGWDYRVGKKYRLIVAPQIDLLSGQFRAANVAIVRDLPDFFLVLSVSYDRIEGETTFSAALRPLSY